MHNILCSVTSVFCVLLSLVECDVNGPIIFMALFTVSLTKPSCRCIKQFAWLLAVIQSLLIVASRKHYSVDVVVAW